jgi:hypothetical protein
LLWARGEEIKVPMKINLGKLEGVKIDKNISLEVVKAVDQVAVDQVRHKLHDLFL